MIQQDYILRMVKQLSAFLVKVLLDKKAGKHEDARQRVESAFKDALGFDSSLFDSLTAQSMLDLLGVRDDPGAAGMKCLVAARLLQEKAEVLRLDNPGEPKALHCDQDSLAMYLKGFQWIGDTKIDLSVFIAGMEEITARLQNDFPDETRFDLFNHYRIEGRFDKAEDELFRLKEAEFPDALEAGREFYRQLINANESDLEKGGLTREEAIEGRKDFFAIPG